MIPETLTGRKRVRFWRGKIVVQLEYTPASNWASDPIYEPPSAPRWRDARAKDVDDVASVLTLFAPPS